MKKNIYTNIIKYKNYIHFNQSKFNFFNNKKIKFILICDFNLLNSLGFKLLKPFFFKLKKLQNYLPYKFTFNLEKQNYNFIKFNKNFLYFSCYSKYELDELIFILKKLTLIPFTIYPLFIFNIKKKIYLSLNNFNLNHLIKLKKSNLINNSIIIFLKRNIFKLLISFNYIKTFCQH